MDTLHIQVTNLGPQGANVSSNEGSFIPQNKTAGLDFIAEAMRTYKRGAHALYILSKRCDKLAHVTPRESQTRAQDYSNYQSVHFPQV